MDLPQMLAGDMSTADAAGADRLHQAVPESKSAQMQGVYRMAWDIAPTDTPVVLMGESGTGKEWLAQLIHRSSHRRGEPMARIICANLTPESLAAYVGSGTAEETRTLKGAGTLFLKEVGELAPELQQRLVCALPGAGCFEPGTSPAGPRLIASTTVDLNDEVRARRFRADLFYRITVACLRLPPLRQRREDVRPLAEQFLRKYSLLTGRPYPRIEPEDWVILEGHAWPGNIRELENVVRRMVILQDTKAVLAEMTSGSLVLPAFQDSSKGSRLRAATRAASRETERRLILEALNRTHWNRKRAARDLQISYKSLLYKLKEMGTDPADPGEC